MEIELQNTHSPGEKEHAVQSAAIIVSTEEGEDGEKEVEMSVTEALDHIGFGRFHIRLLVVAGLGWMADAMWEELSPVLLPQAEKEWGSSSTILGLLVAGQFAGMCTSSFHRC